MKNISAFVVSLLIFFFSFHTPVFAQTDTHEEQQKQETLEGRVSLVLEENQIIPSGAKDLQWYQKLEILIIKGSLKNKKIIVENGKMPMSNVEKYALGEELVISRNKDFEGNDTYYISDYVRRGPLLQLFIIFVVCTIVIAKWRGILSLFGMGISFLVIFSFILPKILAGANPVNIAIMGSLVIIPASFFLSHGVNKKTVVAIIGTLIALLITGVLANIFVESAQLTGFASEEASFLQTIKQGSINIKGLLLAGIIIGVLGVLDDITISQSAIVFQLKEANTKIGSIELYKRAMNVGQDHISSMVNTLVLVYAGAALPLLLLFVDNPHPFSEIINYEIIADEMVRTFVGSIGLILAVPITTCIAVIVVKMTHSVKGATV